MTTIDEANSEDWKWRLLAVNNWVFPGDLVKCRGEWDPQKNPVAWGAYFMPDKCPYAWEVEKDDVQVGGVTITPFDLIKRGSDWQTYALENLYGRMDEIRSQIAEIRGRSATF